jgi:phosphoserine phosphatase
MNPVATHDTRPTSILLTVTGADGPGITSSMMEILANHKVAILDLGQAVIQKLLSLSILFELPNHDEKSVLKDLLFSATERGLKVDFKMLTPEELPSRHMKKKASRFVVTLIGEQLPATALYPVTQTLSAVGLNIDGIQRLSEGEIQTLEMLVSADHAIAESQLKKDLLAIATQVGFDIALQVDGPFRRARRLIAFDMDSTLIQNEVIDELAREKGVYDDVSRITEEAMQGKLDFRESLSRRCALLEDLPLASVDKVFERIKLTPGAEELISKVKKLGYKVALISGGFTFIAERLKESLDLDYVYANKLEVKDGRLTGKVIPPIVDARRKADLLEVIAQQERIRLEQVIAIGDGANDLEMLERAGLGIAFNAKPLVRERADVSFTRKTLAPVFQILGLRHDDLMDELS